MLAIDPGTSELKHIAPICTRREVSWNTKWQYENSAKIDADNDDGDHDDAGFDDKEIKKRKKWLYQWYQLCQ